jgi:cytochrome c553
MTRAVTNLFRASGLVLVLVASAALAQGADSSGSAGPSSPIEATPAAAAPAPAGAPAAEATPPAAPDVKKGAAIAAAVCGACHGVDGNGLGPTFPKLASQHAEYLAKQLTNFKVVPPATSAERPNAIMSPIAASMSNQDMKNVAAYYESQTLKPAQAKNQATVALGQKIWRGGIAEKGVPACAACHGPTGAGIPIQYPRIGGQWQDYLDSQLENFKSGARHNNGPMMTISQRLSDEEMKAVTDYAAGLR